MMGLKLRDIVSYVPTAEGILFRLGDSLLPIRGEGLFEWFGRLQPLLDGNWTADQLLANLDEKKRTIISTVFMALREAGMLYDLDDDPQVLPEAVRHHCKASIRRIEARSIKPFRAFARFWQTRLLILGRAEIVLAWVEAGLELGLRRQIICAVDWNRSFEERLKTIYDRCQQKDMESTVERIEPPFGDNWAALLNDFDVFILAANVDSDRQWLETLLGSENGAAIPWVPLFVCRSCVLAGPMRAEMMTGCPLCLIDYYNEESASPGQTAFCISSGIAIGARLLMQSLLDMRAETLDVTDEPGFWELELKSFHVSRRPLSPTFNCRYCATAMISNAVEAMPFTAPSGTLEPEAFLKRAYKHIIDPKTGLIVQVHEGELLQLPHHQSAALWRLPGAHRRTTWTRERGDDVCAARVAVIRRSLEQYLLRSLSELDTSCLLPVCTLTGEYLRPSMPCSLGPGIVASGTNEESLRVEVFFRALACYANSLDGWTEVSFSQAIIEQDARLTLAYLDDIGMLDSLCIQYHPQFSLAGCQVLRFSYGGNPVSVVAGPAGPAAWSIGLRDAWLHVTGNETLSERADTLPEIYFRCSEDPLTLQSQALNRIATLLSLHLALVPLRWNWLEFAKPLIFAYGQVSQELSSATVTTGTNISNIVPLAGVPTR